MDARPPTPARKYTIKDVYAIFPDFHEYLYADKFIPGVIDYIGCRTDTWNLTGVDMEGVLAQIWQDVMPKSIAQKVPCTDVHSPIYVIVRIIHIHPSISK